MFIVYLHPVYFISRGKTILMNSVTNTLREDCITKQGQSTEQGPSTEQASSSTGPTEQGPSNRIQTRPVPKIIVIPDDDETAEIPNPFPFPATYGTNFDVALLAGIS